MTIKPPPAADKDASEHDLTDEDYRNAPSGIGPLAFEWKNKPHRLVYDLVQRCAASRKAGFEEGRADGRKEREDILRAHVEQRDKIDDMATQVHEYRDRCEADIAEAKAELAATQTELKELRERFERLARVARDIADELRGEFGARLLSAVENEDAFDSINRQRAALAADKDGGGT